MKIKANRFLEYALLCVAMLGFIGAVASVRLNEFGLKHAPSFEPGQTEIADPEAASALYVHELTVRTTTSWGKLKEKLGLSTAVAEWSFACMTGQNLQFKQFENVIIRPDERVTLVLRASACPLRRRGNN